MIGELFESNWKFKTIADLTEFSFKQALSGIKEIRQLNAEEIKFMEFEVVKFIAVYNPLLILVKGKKSEMRKNRLDWGAGIMGQPMVIHY